MCLQLGFKVLPYLLADNKIFLGPFTNGGFLCQPWIHKSLSCLGGTLKYQIITIWKVSPQLINHAVLIRGWHYIKPTSQDNIRNEDGWLGICVCMYVYIIKLHKTWLHKHSGRICDRGLGHTGENKSCENSCTLWSPVTQLEGIRQKMRYKNRQYPLVMSK